jgi:hypothetical protein
MDALRRSGSVVVVRDANHHREPGIIEHQRSLDGRAQDRKKLAECDKR